MGAAEVDDSDRVVPASPVVLDAINAHVDEFGTTDDGLLLYGSVKRAMHSYGKWGDKWKRARTRAELPDTVRYHDLRHHYASELLGHGVSVVAVASAMGDDPATILNTYALLTRSDDDRIREVIEGMWNPSIACDKVAQ